MLIDPQQGLMHAQGASTQFCTLWMRKWLQICSELHVLHKILHTILRNQVSFLKLESIRMLK